jgi:hypothetical protein
MSKTVVINLGNGDLSQGFSEITVRLWAEQSLQAEQIVGRLLAAPELVDFYHIWQSTYRALCGRLVLRLPPSDTIEEELEIDMGGVTQVSQQSFEEFSQQLQQKLNICRKMPTTLLIFDITVSIAIMSLLNCISSKHRHLLTGCNKASSMGTPIQLRETIMKRTILSTHSQSFINEIVLRPLR